MSKSNLGSKNKVALVTGASAGIGKSIVRRLLREGWTVYGGARRVDQMADIKSDGAKVVSLDVTDDVSMRAAVDAVLAAEGRIDALVNNAGYGSYGAIEDVPMAEARRQFEVNVFGLARLAQLVLPSMRERRAGTIVNISSVGGRIWTPFGGWYHATKHTVEVLSDAMRVEVKPFGVNVVVVQPGAINTEWGAIAGDNLRASSESSVYRAHSAGIAGALANSKTGVSPDVVAAAVAKALNSRHPRRRYATPVDAKVLIFLRWILPEAAWERLIRAAIELAAAIGKGQPATLPQRS